MIILMAVIPAIAWGSIGLISGKLGGTANQQTVGMTWGALIFGIAVYGIYQPEMSGKAWIIGIISGLFWSLGQNQQFHAMKAIGISKTVPVSTGLQLAGNALAGVILFGEWKTTRMVVIGTIAMIVIIAGAALTSLKDKKNSSLSDSDKDENTAAGVRAIILSTIGYVGYTIVVHYATVGMTTEESRAFTTATILPQAVGMVIGAGFFALIAHEVIMNSSTFKNILTGLIWGTGNIFMFLSIPKLGQAVSFSFSQMGIVISTFGSIYLLGEKKTNREMVYVTLGSIFVILGVIMLGIMKTL